MTIVIMKGFQNFYHEDIVAKLIAELHHCPGRYGDAGYPILMKVDQTVKVTYNLVLTSHSVSLTAYIWNLKIHTHRHEPIGCLSFDTQPLGLV